jgi:hypothetical protein
VRQVLDAANGDANELSIPAWAGSAMNEYIAVDFRELNQNKTELPLHTAD